jgi:hypothetical protein
MRAHCEVAHLRLKTSPKTPILFYFKQVDTVTNPILPPTVGDRAITMIISSVQFLLVTMDDSPAVVERSKRWCYEDLLCGFLIQV